MRRASRKFAILKRYAIAQYEIAVLTEAYEQVEEFWRYYNHMVRPNDLPNTSDYHLFKAGIKPMWEASVFHFRVLVDVECDGVRFRTRLTN